MTGTEALHILFGAALVAIGVLVAALADRIRSLRAREPARETTQRERVSRTQPLASTAIPVVEPADLLRAAPVKPRAPRTEPKSAPAPTPTEGGDDVISALVAAGFKKPIATEATWACSAAERATIEGWTAAALRRCARGGMS